MASQQGDLEKRMRQLHDAADSSVHDVSSDWSAWIKSESLPKRGAQLSTVMRHRLSDLALAAMAAVLCSNTPPLHDAPRPGIDSPVVASREQSPAPAPALRIAPPAVPESQIAPPLRAPVPPARPTGRPAAVSQRRTVVPDSNDSPGLDETIIRNYIWMAQPRIRYCYERQLLFGHPGLAGTVEAHFVIDASGTVTKSTARGLDPEVAACVAREIFSTRFPEARGGMTKVKYPFQFFPVRR